MIGHNLCDGRCRTICSQQGAPNKMHSPQCKIANWAHSEMFLASVTEGSLRDADGSADFGQIQGVVWIRFQKLFKLRDDPTVLTKATGQVRGGTVSQAPNHQVD